MPAQSIYAINTRVPVERSRAELDSLLGKHGATQRGIMVDDVRNYAVLMFVLKGHAYRMEVPLPTRPKTTLFKEVQKWEQTTRSRWRSIVLLLKAKLELVQIGVSTVEQEFLASMVLPGGSTVGVAIAGQIEGILKGNAPKLLGEGGGV